MNRNSWYGKHLGHHDNWCSLVFESFVWLLIGVCSLSLIGMWLAGNYLMITQLGTVAIDPGSFTANLMSTAIAIDIGLAICAIVFGTVYAKEIGRLLKPCTKWLCPKINWRD